MVNPDAKFYYQWRAGHEQTRSNGVFNFGLQPAQVGQPIKKITGDTAMPTHQTRKLSLPLFIAVAAVLAQAFVPAHAVILVQTNDPGYLNESIGNLLNGTSEAFPTVGDPTLDFTTAPDLSAAADVLGGWLNQPYPDLSAPGWSTSPVSVPSNWTVNTEIAFVYPFVSGGVTNLVAQFGVDNGIFVWLDGNFVGGALRPGGVVLGEHTYALGDLSAGTHNLQVLLEDHGSTNGFAVLIQADEVLPPVPAPAAFWLFGTALGLAGMRTRRRT
jgi:hypothetical protein